MSLGLSDSMLAAGPNRSNDQSLAVFARLFDNRGCPRPFAESVFQAIRSLRGGREVSCMTRLTTNSQETTLGDLLSIGTSLYLIPFFQREYRWAPDKVNNLIDDIRNVVDGVTDKHFLGAIIVHGRRANPTDPKVFEVIDGQQRLTTAFLFMCALVKTLSNNAMYNDAASLVQTYIQTGKQYKNSNLRIQSSRLDRTMMSSVIADLKSDPKLLEAMSPHTLVALPNYGTPTGVIKNNYNRFKRFFAEEMDDGGIDRVRQIYGAFLGNFTVVQIDVLDPTDGPKIFDSLNSKQQPMKISDLVRNEIFRKIVDESPEHIEHIDEHLWQPFYSSFDLNGVNYFEKFLFPFGLVGDANLRKSDVFIKLRTQWAAIGDPVEIISSFQDYRAPYLDTIHGRNECGFDSSLALRFWRLSMLGAPSSILPFTMKLGKAVFDGVVSDASAIDVMDVIETFLVRRAIAGHEPTGLHAVFKRLWIDIDGDMTAASVTKALSSHTTVVWPKEPEVRMALECRKLYGAAITPYLLLEFDRSLGGDTHDRVETIEHVLPQNPGPQWKLNFEEEIENVVHTIANLVPCTSPMNSSLGNQPYDVKRARFVNDSKFKSTRAFGEDFDVWNSETLKRRSATIVEWALARWPHEPSD
jgi:hypothetical protein